MAKFKEKIKAQELRKQGQSIKDIAKNLGVSPGSVSVWCQNVVLSENQIKELEKRRKDPNYGGRLANSNKQHQIAVTKTKELLSFGIKQVGKLSKRELFLVGSALYWAEGFKKDSQAGFANSSPDMMNLYLRWLFECFDYEVKDLSPRVTVNLSHKHRIKEIEKFWSLKTKIPLEDFQKPFFQNFKWKKVYDNPNEYFGVLRIKVRKSTDFLRKIHGFIEGLRLESRIE